ncbi:MAG TPA: alpha/beta family hydrolase [Vicinamibacterales bacterium]|nr:alpha/beta family hydrolase [Vicinamibacterales bacterium]
MPTQAHAVRFNAAGVYIDADVSIPPGASGMIVFVHGSGSSRHSPRNQFVAAHLQAQGLGTVLMDLLTPTEERADQFSGHLRFDIGFLARRVIAVLDDVREQAALPIGLFGASTGAAAALMVAVAKSARIGAVVSRGGRPDLAADSLPLVQAPTLLIVGGGDREVLALNQKAMERMKAEVRLEIVPGASHLFHEPGALETVAHLAADWFTTHIVDSHR